MANEGRTEETAEELANESAYDDETDFKRQLLRNDESKGDANDRDVAGDYRDQSSTGDVTFDQGLANRNRGR